MDWVSFTFGNNMTYTFPVYYAILAGLLAVMSGVLGVLFIRRRLSNTVAYCAIVVALFLGVLITPMLLIDKVVLDDEKLEQTTGFWLSPTIKGFELSGLSSVVISSKKDKKDREFEVWTANYEDGQSIEIDPGDLWEMNGADIISRLEARGIKISR